MSIHFLFSYEVIDSALKIRNSSTITDSTIVCKQAINIMEKFKENEDGYGFKIWTTAQSLSKLESSLNEEQKERLKGVFCSENKTNGVPNYNEKSSMIESARNLSLSGISIVICDKDEKSEILSNNPNLNKKIVLLTPSELLTRHELATKIFNNLPLEIKNTQFSDLFLLSLYKPEYANELVNRIC